MLPSCSRTASMGECYGGTSYSDTQLNSLCPHENKSLTTARARPEAGAAANGEEKEAQCAEKVQEKQWTQPKSLQINHKNLIIRLFPFTWCLALQSMNQFIQIKEFVQIFKKKFKVMT